MDEEALRRRREEARRRVYRRRRLVAAGWRGSCALLVLAVGLLVAAGGGDDEPEASPEPRPAELPRGGRTILPGQARGGLLRRAAGPRARRAGDRLAAAGRANGSSARRDPTRARGRPVLPAFELIAAIVTSEAGRRRGPLDAPGAATIRRYLRAARAHKMLLLLDIQPGYAPFLQEAQALEHFLKEPDVSLALDPEWSMDPPQLPGPGDRLDRRGDGQRGVALPVGHRAQVRPAAEAARGAPLHGRHDPGRARPGAPPGRRARRERGRLRRPAEQDLEVQRVHADLRRRFNGFKLFYHEDVNLMKPKQVLRLRPQPDLVVYE